MENRKQVTFLGWKHKQAWICRKHMLSLMKCCQKNFAVLKVQTVYFKSVSVLRKKNDIRVIGQGLLKFFYMIRFFPVQSIGPEGSPKKFWKFQYALTMTRIFFMLGKVEIRKHFCAWWEIKISSRRRELFMSNPVKKLFCDWNLCLGGQNFGNT